MHVPPFTYTNTFHVSLTEEFPQRDVITSELETRINLNECFLYFKICQGYPRNELRRVLCF